MPRSVTVKAPDGSIVVYDNVPDGVSTAEVEARARREALKEDLPKAAASGVVAGGINSTLRQVGPAADAGAQLVDPFNLSPAARVLRALSAESQRRAEPSIRAVEEKLGANLRPATKEGEYVKSGAQGLMGGLLSPGPGLSNSIQGILSGLATQGAHNLGTGVLGEAGASMLPTAVAAVTKRLLGTPPAAKVAQQTMAGTTEAEHRAAQAVASRAASSGVDLLPGQTYAPDHPITGLQASTAMFEHGGPGLQAQLRKQGQQAMELGDKLRTAAGPALPEQQAAEIASAGMKDRLAGRQARVEKIVKPAYAAVRNEPVSPLDVATIQNGIEAAGKRLGLASTSERGRFLGDQASALVEDKVKVPAVTTGRRTLTVGPDGPVKKTITRTVAPATVQDVPVDTVGKLLDLRGDVRAKWPDRVPREDPARQAVVEAINGVLHQNPGVAAADAKFGRLTDRYIAPLTNPGPPSAPTPVTPSSLMVRANPQTNPGALGEALNTDRFPLTGVTKMLDTVERRSPGFSRGLLAQRLERGMQEAAAVAPTEKSGQQAAILAASVGAPGTKNRGLVEALAARSEGAVPVEQLDTLARTGLGRQTMGKVAQSETKAGGQTVGPVVARMAGTNPLLAAAPVLGKRIEKRAQVQLSEALADPSGKKLQDLLAVNPNMQFVLDALRARQVTAAQGFTSE